MVRVLLGITLTAVAGAQGSVAELVAPHGEAGDVFGAAVAIGPRHVLVGAPWEGPKMRGRAYLYRRSDGALKRSFAPTDWAPKDILGISVAVDDEVAVLGCYSDEAGMNSGSAYVYDLDSGQLRFKLLPPNGQAGDIFGCAVALGPGYIAVGASGDDAGATDAGAVFIFSRESGALLREFRAAAPREKGRLGHRLAVDGPYVVASSTWDVGSADNVGAVFVFDVLLGQQRHRLQAWDRASYDFFGASLAAGDGLALIGAPGYDGSGIDDIGKAYLFDLGTGEHLLDVNAPPDVGDKERFGNSVALGDGVLVLGAPGSDRVADGGGQVYVYDMEGEQIDAFGDPAEGDRFGQYVAAYRSRVVVSAPQADTFGTGSGSAHLYCLHRHLGQTYCGPAQQNSTGLAARVGTFGARDLGCARFDLSAQQVPPGAPCLALVSAGEDFVQPAWGGQGILCLAEPVGVFLLDVTPAAPDGRVAIALDLLRPLPRPIGQMVASGESWRLQVWYRDRNPSPTTNMTDAVRVTFE